MNPAAIYVRVSKEDGSQTTDNQLPDVQQMATGRGYTVAPEHVYADEGISGAKGADERPALAAMLQAAARGRFRAVFVWRLDRLSRDDTFRGGLTMVADLDRYSVALMSHQETWLDTSGPFRGALVQISLTLAAEERRTLIARTRAGIARARAKGTKSGRPIGVPPAQFSSDALGWAAQRVRSGMSWRAAWAGLEARGDLRPYFGGKRDGALPSVAALYRACTKGYPDLLPATPPKSRRRAGAAART